MEYLPHQHIKLLRKRTWWVQGGGCKVVTRRVVIFEVTSNRWERFQTVSAVRSFISSFSTHEFRGTRRHLWRAVGEVVWQSKFISDKGSCTSMSNMTTQLGVWEKTVVCRFKCEVTLLLLWNRFSLREQAYFAIIRHSLHTQTQTKHNRHKRDINIHKELLVETVVYTFNLVSDRIEKTETISKKRTQAKSKAGVNGKWNEKK